MKTDAQDIPLDVNALFAVYDEANRNAVRKAQGGVSVGGDIETPSKKETATESTQAVRRGRRKTSDDEVSDETPVEVTGNDGVDSDDTDDTAADTGAVETPVEEPKPRTRKTRRTTENN